MPHTPHPPPPSPPRVGGSNLNDSPVRSAGAATRRNHPKNDATTQHQLIVPTASTITPASLPNTTPAFEAAQEMMQQATNLRNLHHQLPDPVAAPATSDGPVPINFAAATSSSSSSTSLTVNLLATYSLPPEVTGPNAEWNQNFQLALNSTICGSTKSNSDNNVNRLREISTLIDELLSQFSKQCETVIAPYFVESLFDPEAMNRAEADAALDPLLQRARRAAAAAAASTKTAGGFGSAANLAASAHGSAANLFSLSSMYGSAFRMGDAAGAQLGREHSENDLNNNLSSTPIGSSRHNNGGTASPTDSSTAATVAASTVGEFEVKASLVAGSEEAIAQLEREIEAQRFFMAALLTCCFVRPLPVTIAPMWLGSFQGHRVLVSAMPRLVPGSSNRLTEVNHPDFAAALQIIAEACGFEPYEALLSDGTKKTLFGPPSAAAAYGADGRVYVTSMAGLLPFFPAAAAAGNGGSAGAVASFSLATALRFIEMKQRKPELMMTWCCGALLDESASQQQQQQHRVRESLRVFASEVLFSGENLAEQQLRDPETDAAMKFTKLQESGISSSMLGLLFAALSVKDDNNSGGASNALLLDRAEQFVLVEILARSLVQLLAQRVSAKIEERLVLSAAEATDLPPSSELLSALAAQFCTKEGIFALWHETAGASSNNSKHQPSSSSSSNSNPNDKQEQEQLEEVLLPRIIATLFPGTLRALQRRICKQSQQQQQQQQQLPNPLTLISPQKLLERFAALTGVTFAPGVSASSGSLAYHFVTDKFVPVTHCCTGSVGAAALELEAKLLLQQQQQPKSQNNRSLWKWRRDLFDSKQRQAAAVAEVAHSMVLDWREQQQKPFSLGCFVWDALHAAFALRTLQNNNKKNAEAALNLVNRALEKIAATTATSTTARSTNTSLFTSYLAVLCHVEAARCLEEIAPDQTADDALAELNRATIASGEIQQRWAGGRFVDSTAIISALAIPIFKVSGRLHDAKGEAEKAEADMRAVYSIQKRLFGSSLSSSNTHLARGIAAGALGMVLTTLGRHKEAERCLREELTAWESVAEENEKQHRQQQQQEDAEDEPHTPVVGGAGSSADSGSAATVVTFSNINNINTNIALRKQQQQQQQQPSYETVMAKIQRAAFPPSTPAIGSMPLVLNNLGCLLVSVKKFDDAVDLYQREIQILEGLLLKLQRDKDNNNSDKKSSNSDEERLIRQELHLVRINLATAYMHQTQWSQADLLFALCQEQMELDFGVASIEAGEIMVKRAMLYVAQLRSMNTAYPLDQRRSPTPDCSAGGSFGQQPPHQLPNTSFTSTQQGGTMSTSLGLMSGEIGAHVANNSNSTNNINSGGLSANALACFQDGEPGYRMSLLQSAQQLLSTAYGNFDAVAEASKGAATIESSGVGVKQLLKRCCHVGSTAAKEAQDPDLQAVWVGRARKTYA